MAMNENVKTESAASEFVYTRVVNAPRELVWKAYSEAKHLQNWWGPKGFSIEVERLDFRPNGTFLYSMTLPDGNKMYGKLAYREMDSPERLVFVVSFTDSEGTPIRHPMSPTWPLEVYNETTFTEEDGKTTIHIVGKPINATDEEQTTFVSGLSGMNKGTDGSMEQLESYLSTL